MARCRHYCGLRTLLARKLRDRFQLSDSLPGVSAQSRGSSVIDHHVMYFDLPLMKALDWAKISGKLSDNILKMQCVCGGGEGVHLWGWRWGWVLILPFTLNN